MKIEVCEYPDMSHSDIAWAVSRPGAEISSFEEGGSEHMFMDTYLNDIPSFFISVKCTILEREIFSSMVGHVMWAQASRVTDPIKFTVPEHLSRYDSIFEKAREKMEFARFSGIRQDEYRLHLPIYSETEFTCRVGLRHFVKLAKLFDKISHRGGILGVVCSRAYNEMHATLRSIFSAQFVISAFEKYSTVDFITPPEDFEAGVVGTKNGFTTVSATVPFSLRTHLARHNVIQMNDNILGVSNSSHANLNTPVNVELSAQNVVWKSIYSKRSCWLAHHGLWENLLSSVASKIKIDESVLPCNVGGCPYDSDAEARYTDADPGAPCPIHADMKKITLDEEQREKVIEQIIIDKRPSFWRHY